MDRMEKTKQESDKFLQWFLTETQVLIAVYMVFTQPYGKLSMSARVYIYGNAILPILVDVFLLVQLIRICRNRKKIKSSCMILVLCILTCAVLWTGSMPAYWKDMQSTVRTISSSYFQCNKRLTVYDPVSGEMLDLSYNKRQREYAQREKPEWDESRLWQAPAGGLMFPSKGSVEAAYYPNTKIIQSLTYRAISEELT